MNQTGDARPLIGVTLDEGEGGYADAHWLALRSNYCAAISVAGGLPLLLPPGSGAAERYLQLCDGLLLTGGMAPIDDRIYGDHTELDPRSRFELRLIDQALARDTPMLGICRGMQLMAVAGGGKLHLDLHEISPALDAHLRESSPDQMAHDVLLEPGTRLASLAGVSQIAVNSIHRQAVAEVGSDWRVAGRSGDAVIEAIERADRRFCIGVQWHPEYRLNPLDGALFAALISAAGELACAS